MTTPHVFSPVEAIKTGWNYTKTNFWTMMKLLFIGTIPNLVGILVIIMMLLIPGAIEVVVNPTTNAQEIQLIGNYETIANIVSLVSAIFSAWLGLALIKPYLQIAQGKKVNTRNLGIHVSYLARYLGASILCGIIVILGFIALIIPGIYFALKLSQYQFFIVEGYSAIDSLKASREVVTRKNISQLITISFLYMGIAILGIITLGIGLLRAIPTITLAQAWIYLQLKKSLPDTFKVTHQ